MRRAHLHGATVLAAVAWLLLVPAVGAVADVEGPGDATDDAEAGEPEPGDDEIDGDQAAEEEEAALEEGATMSGYRLRAEAAPLAALLWEPLLPFPVDPGMPHLEAQAAYSRSTFNTGPSGRALASTLWPGATLGDSLEQIVDDTDYPVMANSRVPQGPEEEVVELGPGMGMETSADGTGTMARSTTTEAPSDVMGIGTFESTSHTYLDDGEAVAIAHSAISDISLFGGIIEFDGITTELEARGDGVDAETAGSTTALGLTIAGFGFVVDEDGLQPETGEETDEDPPLPFDLGFGSPDELREALGIEVELMPHEEEIDGALAERTGGGLRISIDLAVLRDLLVDPLLEPLVEVLPDELTQLPLPDEVPVNPVDLLFLEPQVDVILASAAVEANTVEQLDVDGGFDAEPDDFEPGDPEPPTEASAPDVDQAADVDAPDDAADLSSSPVDAPETADPPEAMDDGEAVADPEVSETPPGEEPEVRALDAASLDPAGSAVVASLVALGLAGLAARGLHGMTARVFGGAGGCPSGHPTGVPNLKELG